MILFTRINRLRFFLFSICIFASFLSASLDVHAGGMEVPDLGAVGIGRGGAFTARADSPLAIQYNPAGLAKARGRNLLIGISFMNLNLDFKRKGGDPHEFAEDHVVYNPADNWVDYDQMNYDPKQYGSISGEHKLSVAPLIASSWGDFMHVKGLTLSLGLITPSGFSRPKFPKNGPGRYAVREVSAVVGYSSIGLAYKFNRYFQIGAMYQNCFFQMKAQVAIRPNEPVTPMPNDLPNTDKRPYNENSDGDAHQTVDAIDVITPTGVIGVMSNPLDWLEIGASVKLPSIIEAEGDVGYIAPKTLQDSGLKGNKVNVHMLFPWVVRTGVRYIHRYFDIEVDYVWEKWSDFKGAKFEMVDVFFCTSVDRDECEVEIPPAQVVKNFRDTHSVRLGSDIEVWPENITMRVGGYYQTSAYPDDYSTFSVDYPFGEQIGAGLGLTWHAHKVVDVNVGYLHVFQLDVEVEDGIQQQISLPGPDGKKLGNTINNGTYEVSMNMFSLSTEFHF